MKRSSTCHCARFVSPEIRLLHVLQHNWTLLTITSNSNNGLRGLLMRVSTRDPLVYAPLLLAFCQAAHASPSLLVQPAAAAPAVSPASITSELKVTLVKEIQGKVDELIQLADVQTGWQARLLFV